MTGLGWWWLLAACPKPAAGPPPLDGAGLGPTSVRAPIAGPRYWAEPGGLCLEIPAGWSGTTGPEPHLLILEDEDGIRFEVTATAGPPPDERPGHVSTFADDGSYRTVPILTPSATRTWREDAPLGRTVQGWYAPLGGRLVGVEVSYPFGHATDGRDRVDGLLRGLCTTWR